MVGWRRSWVALLVVCGAATAQQSVGPMPAPNGLVRWDLDNWNKQRTEFWKNRNADKGAVVFVGDSIVQHWRELPERFPDLKVARRGISGDYTTSLLFRLKEDVLDTQPSAIVLLIGSNDLGLANRTPAETAKNLERILDVIAAYRKDLLVILCKVMPRGDGVNPKVVELNGLIERMAAKRPTVSICDTYSLFPPTNPQPFGGVSMDEYEEDTNTVRYGWSAACCRWADALEPILIQLKLLKPGGARKM